MIEITKLPKIELLNSEGPILVAYKTPNFEFHIVDQEKQVIDFLTLGEMINFVGGNGIIFNSKKETIKYSQFPDGMKPSKRELSEFINFKF